MLRYHVPDMTCGHCSRAITQAVQAAAADARVLVDLAQKTVQVETTHDAATVEAAIREAGYTPEAG
jgi:copper chaperone